MRDGRKQEYYITGNLNLAQALAYLSYKYFTFDDKFNEGKKVYTFKKTEELLADIEMLKSTRAKRNKY